MDDTAGPPSPETPSRPSPERPPDPGAADPELPAIYSPEQLARVERPLWRRLVLDRLERGEAWPRVRDSFAGQVLIRFLEDAGARDATLIAWSCLVSLLPLLIAVPVVTVQVLRVVGIDVSDLDGRAFLTLIPVGPMRTTLLDALQSVSHHQVLFGVAAVIGILWRGSALFRQLEICLSRIAGVRPRAYLRRLLLSVLLLVLISAGSMVAAGGTAILIGNPAFRIVAHPVADTLAAFGFQVVLGLVSGFAIFLFIYGVIPNHAYRLRQVWPGAAVAAICFEVLTLIFPLYQAAERGFDAYGTGLALLIVLVVYFFFLGVIVVVGADVNAVLWRRRPDRS